MPAWRAFLASSPTISTPPIVLTSNIFVSLFHNCCPQGPSHNLEMTGFSLLAVERMMPEAVRFLPASVGFSSTRSRYGVSFHN